MKADELHVIAMQTAYKKLLKYAVYKFMLPSKSFPYSQ